MKGAVQTTREFTLTLDEQEAMAISRLSDFLQKEDLEAACRRGKLVGDYETGTLIELLKRMRELVHEPSSR